MLNDIPSVEALKTSLLRLTHARVKTLAAESGVPFTTLWKVRAGTTKNPRIETVRNLLPHLAAAVKSAKRAKAAA